MPAFVIPADPARTPGFPAPRRPKGPTGPWWGFVVVLVLVAPLVDGAQASTVVVQRDGLEVLTHHAHVEMDGSIVVTTTGTVFRNPFPDALGTTIMLPLTPTAVLESIEVQIDGETLAGAVQESGAARRDFEEARQAGEAAALLRQYAKQYVLELNVPAHESIRLDLVVVDWVGTTNGLRSYTLPLTAWNPPQEAIDQVEVTVDVRAARPWQDLTVSGLKMQRTDHSDRNSTFFFAANAHRFAADASVRYSPGGDPYAPTLVVAGTDGVRPAILSLMPPPNGSTSLPMDIVFVLDRSGSMAGDKIVQAREALTTVVEQLRAQDRFTLVRFSTDVQAWGGLVPASVQNRDAARAWILDTTADGGTNIEGGLQAALSRLMADGDAERVQTVVLITDGQPTVGVTDPGTILDRVAATEPDESVRIHALGIGFDRDDHFLRTLTEGRRGLYEAVDPRGDVGTALQGFLSRVTMPVVRDVTIDVIGRSCGSRHPDPLPDLYAGDPLLLACRLDAAGLPADLAVRLRGGTADGPLDVTRTVPAADLLVRPEAERLWARLGADDLERRIRFAEDAETRDRLTQDLVTFGVEFQVATSRTSWVLADEAPEPRFAGMSADSAGLQQTSASHPYATGTTSPADARDMGWADGTQGTTGRAEPDAVHDADADAEGAAPGAGIPLLVIAVAALLVSARRLR